MLYQWNSLLIMTTELLVFVSAIYKKTEVMPLLSLGQAQHPTG